MDLQSKTIRMVKVRLARRMLERPIGKPAVDVFDHRGKSELQDRARLYVRQTIQAKDRVQLQHLGFSLDGDFRVQSVIINRPALAIFSKSISRPFTRRRKIKLVITWLSFGSHKCLKTGLLP